jgi:alpha-glucosidase (family GH31 glycosyl hydrolase)
VIALEATVQGAGPAVEAIGVGFDADRGAHYLGFGERSNAIDQRGNVVENYVADGPYLPDEYGLIDAIVPKWGFRPRDDATYYPIPWLLSTDGYGVLVESPETTYFHLDLNGSWSAEVVNAPPDEPPPPGAPPPGQLSMRFFAGPQPADVLKRFTRETGRQPKPAAPWLFGPWLQPVGDPSEQEALIDRVQEADAPVSVAQTYLHYLPCGAQRGLRDAERARTQAMHERGLAITTYFNPMVCTEYGPVFEDAAAGGGLIENDAGRPYLFQYSTTSSFLVAEFDFTAAAGRDAFESVVDEAIEDGHDGWMEDFGEYTPLNSRNQAGVPGTALHNPYVREYHCAANDAIADAPRPIVRFQRSGWTGTAPCAEVVWGGDPTTVWGFDGLESAIRQALTIGLSGIGIWGSDIGGYFSLFGNQLDPELLTRWVQLGAVSGVMRTEADGIAIPEYQRPQVWDPDQFANWRRYTKLRTQLYPYLVAAGSSYRHSGLPLMRQLALAYPDDKKAIDQDDEFLLGPNLLAAPVIEAGATKRSVYLPRGRWIDFWRSIAYEESDGSLEMKRAKLLRGGREVSLPAPLEELPLLARAGTILPLLPASVDTLSDYPDDSTISLSERRKRLALFAFPRGKSSTRLYEDEHIYSRERPNRWALRINGDHKRTYELRASMRTLSRPFTPCRVSLGGEPLAKARWDYDSKQQILSTSLEGRKLRVVARGEC